MNRQPSKWLDLLDNVLTHDFCPRVDPYLFDWAKTPLGMLGLAASISFLCGYLLHPHGYAIGCGIVAVIGLGLIWPWLNLRGLRGDVTFGAARACEEDPVTLKLIVRNRMP